MPNLFPQFPLFAKIRFNLFDSVPLSTLHTQFCDIAKGIILQKSLQTKQCDCCCCCSAYLSSCHQTASDANLLDDPHTFHYNDYFVIGGIRTCLEVSDDPMLLWISSNSCPLNLLLVRSHQTEIIIVKRLIQERKNVNRVWVEPRPFDQGCCKNDAFTQYPFGHAADN